jgi:hypothetical protein
MPIYAQATTETTPSEEKGIQQKDNTSSLLPVLLRAVSQLGVLKRLAGYLRQGVFPGLLAMEIQVGLISPVGTSDRPSSYISA